MWYTPSMQKSHDEKNMKNEKKKKIAENINKFDYRP